MTFRDSWMLIAIMVLAVACSREQIASQPATAPIAVEPLSPLDQPNLTDEQIAKICESEIRNLKSVQRDRCGRAHLRVAATLLDRKDYVGARTALSFAQTEYASYDEIAAMRKRIPDYDKLAGLGKVEETQPATEAERTIRQSAANRLTQTFGSSLLQGFEIKAFAAGKDCSVLLVTFYVKMEDPMISAMHYGNLIYGRILPGGTSGFAAQNHFDTVVYRDGYDTTWIYGNLSQREAARLKNCS